MNDQTKILKPRIIKSNIKTDEPFNIIVNKKSYSGHLHFPEHAQFPTRMEVVINQKKIASIYRGQTRWRISLNDEGMQMFPELNKLTPYEAERMAEDLGYIVETNWNSPYWPGYVKQ